MKRPTIKNKDKYKRIDYYVYDINVYVNELEEFVNACRIGIVNNDLDYIEEALDILDTESKEV